MTREEAINNIKEHCYFANLLSQAKEALDEAIKALEQEPKTGHWIETDGGVECDKCGKWYPHAPIAKNVIKFCCECGAKMEGEE